MYPVCAMAGYMMRPPMMLRTAVPPRNQPSRTQVVNHSYLNMHHKKMHLGRSSSGNSIAYPEQVGLADRKAQSENSENKKQRRRREDIEQVRRELNALEHDVGELTGRRRQNGQTDRKGHRNENRRGTRSEDRGLDESSRETRRYDTKTSKESGDRRGVSEGGRERDKRDKERHEARIRTEQDSRRTEDARHGTDDVKKKLTSYKHENNRLKKKIEQMEGTYGSDDVIKELREENSKLKDRVRRRDTEIKRFISHIKTDYNKNTTFHNHSDNAQHSSELHTSSDKASRSRTKHHGDAGEKHVLRRKPVRNWSTPGVQKSKACVIS